MVVGGSAIPFSNNIHDGARQVNYFISSFWVGGGWFTYGSAGTPTQLTLDGTGAEDPVNWTISDGSLPPGMDLSSSGLLSGRPTEEFELEETVMATPEGSSAEPCKVYSFTIRGRDAHGVIYEQACNFPVILSIRSQITSLTLPTGVTEVSGAAEGDDTIAVVFKVSPDGVDPNLIGSLYHFAGVGLSPGNTAPWQALLPSEPAGIGAWEQSLSPGTWGTTLCLLVRFGPGGWRGYISYDVIGPLYGTKTLTVSRYVDFSGGGVPPPAMDGSATVVFS